MQPFRLVPPSFWSMALATSLVSLSLAGCSKSHWAEVKTADIPPSPEARVLHASRVVVHITPATDEPQCVAYERYRPVCFYNIRPTLEAALRRQLWPAFPDVVFGEPADASPSDYLLQVELELDALPPDDAGPGWSAGARSRFRLMREGKVLAEETLASRSRAEFPYGAPLGAAASEVLDASLVHIAMQVSRVEEAHPPRPTPLPSVAARKIESAAETKSESSKPSTDMQSPAKNAKAK